MSTGLDLEEILGEQDRLGKDTKGGFLDIFVKMPDKNGAVIMRLLPPARPGTFDRQKNRFFVETRIHRVNTKSLHCPKVLDKGTGRWIGDCPICKYYNWLWQQSDKMNPEEAAATQAKARAIKPIERYYYNVIVRTQYNEKTGDVLKNVGPKIFSCGKTLHTKIVNAIAGNQKVINGVMTGKKGLGDVSNIKVGRDFQLNKTMRQSGKDSFANYDDSEFLDQSPLGTPEEVEKWLGTLNDLQALRKLLPNEVLKHELKVHLGLAKDTSDSFDPSEYQTPVTGEAPVVTQTAAPVVEVAAPAPVSDVVKEVMGDTAGGEGPADDDFLNQLNELDKK